MKLKTTDLTGAALDWAVALALGHEKFPKGKLNVGVFGPVFGKGYKHAAIGLTKADYSTSWKHGGPIIEREMKERGFDVWQVVGAEHALATYERGLPDSYISGRTPLIAAMRCYVASKLGDEVEVPDTLVTQ